MSTPWTETPAPQVPTAPRSGEWCDRLHRNADLSTMSAVSFHCGVEKSGSSDYSIHVYDEADATDMRPVFLRPSFPGAFREPRGAEIPYNPKWKPSGGTDGHMAVLGANGFEWDLWAALMAPDWWERTKASWDAGNKAVGYTGGTGVILAASFVELAPGERKPGVFVVDPLAAGVVRAREVASGEINHPVGLIVGKQSSMTGPAAPAGMSPDDPRIGTIYGCAVAPCTIFESRNKVGDLTKMVSDGRRFHLTYGPAEAQRRIKAAGLTGALANVTMIFYEAFAAWGWFVNHTSDGRAAFTGDGSDPKAWQTLGITTPQIADTFLRPLFQSAADYRCVDTPISVLADGSETRREGRAVATFYR